MQERPKQQNDLQFDRCLSPVSPWIDGDQSVHTQVEMYPLYARLPDLEDSKHQAHYVLALLSDTNQVEPEGISFLYIKASCFSHSFGVSSIYATVPSSDIMPFVTSFLHRQLLSQLPEPTTSFKGRTVIVTGSNTGLGRETCRWIVRLGASHVILACRNVGKGDAAAKDIMTTTGCSKETLEVWQIDMASYESVKAFAVRVKTELPRLDVLIANAGINSQEFRLLEDNEAQVTINCVSLFLLGFLLLPTLRNTAIQYNTQTHFTITSSDLHETAKFEERRAPPGQIFAALNDGAKFPGGDRYATSKLLEILVVREIASLLPVEANNVIINCVSPG